MNLTDLLHGLAWQHVSGPLDKAISGLTLDSRTVKPGMLFVALHGETVDGHKFVADAVARGAAAIAVTAGGAALAPDITVVRVEPAAQTLAHLGIDLAEISTQSSLVMGLREALAVLGLEVVRKS